MARRSTRSRSRSGGVRRNNQRRSMGYSARRGSAGRRRSYASRRTGGTIRLVIEQPRPAVDPALLGVKPAPAPKTARF